jgi:hypothetical protein
MARHIVKTAAGKTIDMAALKAKHGDTITVGNMHTNARGDRLDPKTGKVTKTRREVKAEQYKLNNYIPVNAPVTKTDQQLELERKQAQAATATATANDDIFDAPVTDDGGSEEPQRRNKKGN